MQLCAITAHRHANQPLLSLVKGWSNGGVDYLQLRAKHLAGPQLQALAQEVRAELHRGRAKLLVNIPAPEWAPLALAAGADGVHLAGKPLPDAAGSVRRTFHSGGREAIVSVPCHSLEEVEAAVKERVDLILFSPVFEKLAEKTSEKISPAAVHGLEGLRRACVAAQGIAVFALGGVTSLHAPECVAVGAAGVAGIRLFATDDWRRLGTPS